MAAVVPATYLTVFARLDIAAKLILVVTSVANCSQEDPRRQLPGSRVVNYYFSAALSTFREAAKREFVDSSTSVEAPATPLRTRAFKESYDGSRILVTAGSGNPNPRVTYFNFKP